jgi:hypothetical protein
MNYVFGDDLKFFVKFLPRLTDREEFAIQIENEKTGITTDEAVKASLEHDALHYISQQPFNQEGEECVAYLEKTFNRGWLPLGEKYNTFKPKECECSHITQELITETAEKILMHTNARIKRHKREKIRQIEKRKLTRMYGK